MSEEFRQHLGIIGAIGLGICLIHIIGLLLSCCLYIKLKDPDDWQLPAVQVYDSSYQSGSSYDRGSGSQQFIDASAVATRSSLASPSSLSNYEDGISLISSTNINSNSLPRRSNGTFPNPMSQKKRIRFAPMTNGSTYTSSDSIYPQDVSL